MASADGYDDPGALDSDDDDFVLDDACGESGEACPATLSPLPTPSSPLCDNSNTDRQWQTEYKCAPLPLQLFAFLVVSVLGASSHLACLWPVRTGDPGSTRHCRAVSCRVRAPRVSVFVYLQRCPRDAGRGAECGGQACSCDAPHTFGARIHGLCATHRHRHHLRTGHSSPRKICAHGAPGRQSRRRQVPRQVSPLSVCCLHSDWVLWRKPIAVLSVPFPLQQCLVQICGPSIRPVRFPLRVSQSCGAGAQRRPPHRGPPVLCVFVWELMCVFVCVCVGSMLTFLASPALCSAS